MINIKKCLDCKYRGEHVYNHFVNKYTAIWCLHSLCVGKVGVTGRLSSKNCPFTRTPHRKSVHAINNVAKIIFNKSRGGA